MRCDCKAPIFEDDQGWYSQEPVTIPDVSGLTFTLMGQKYTCADGTAHKPRDLDVAAQNWVPDEMVTAALAAFSESGWPAERPDGPEPMRRALLAGFMFAQRVTVWADAGAPTDRLGALALEDLGADGDRRRDEAQH